MIFSKVRQYDSSLKSQYNEVAKYFKLAGHSFLYLSKYVRLQ